MNTHALYLLIWWLRQVNSIEELALKMHLYLLKQSFFWLLQKSNKHLSFAEDAYYKNSQEYNYSMMIIWNVDFQLITKRNAVYTYFTKVISGLHDNYQCAFSNPV